MRLGHFHQNALLLQQPHQEKISLLFDLQQCMISANLHYLNLLDEPKQLILSVVLLQHLHSNYCASSLSINLNITLVHREKGQSKIVK